MERVLVTGVSGRIGRELVKRVDELFASEVDISLLENKSSLGMLARDLDRRNIKIVDPKYFTSERYDLAIHLAAITGTKYCSEPKNREEVRRVNVGLTERVCGISDRTIFVSSDNVFKGDQEVSYREDDSTNPCNYYGQTKVEGENIVLDKKGVVVRIQTLLGVPNRIVDKVLNEINGIEDDYYPLWRDRFSRPSYFEDLFRVVKKLSDSDKSGIYHVSCDGEPISRSEIGGEVLRILRKHEMPIKVDKLNYECCAIGGFPRYLVLDATKTKAELGLEFTDLREALERHVVYSSRTN